MSDLRRDEPIPLTRLRAALAAPRGTRRLDALLSADDTEAQVQALTVTELYQIITDVGLADTVELVALASPQQIQGCLDMELWDRDALQVDAVKPWLAALVEVGFEKLGQVWEGLDPELRALVLARYTHIYDLSLEEEPDDSDGLPIFTTPDTFFAIKVTTADEDTVRLVHRVVEDLYRADMALAQHTIMAARTEPANELEEMSFRWRAGRMADLGYSDYYEALEVFRPLDPASVHIGEGTEDRFGTPVDEAEVPARLPAPVAEGIAGRSFLARAMDRIQEAEHAQRLEQAFLVLVNKVLAAARVKPGDSEAMALGAEHATATVALGLEHVSKGDVGRAADALRTISLVRLHRLGYSLTLRLAQLARALAPRAGTAGDPAPAILAALLGRRPFFPRELDDPPGAGLRPFETGEDIRRIAETLTALALRVAIASSLGVELLAPDAREAAAHGAVPPRLDDHVRTALARVVLGGPLDAAPLTPADLRTLKARGFAGERLTDEARTRAGNALLAQLETAQIEASRELLAVLVGEWLDHLERELGPVRDQDIDPRFVDGLLIARN